MSHWTNVFPDFFQNLWNDWTGITANQQNIDYQNAYNQEVFKRADTQYQRTIADLRASGLSAQLAAGSPSTVAGSSAAPQRTVGNESQAIERLIGIVNSIKETKANVGLAAAQAENQRAQAAVYKAEAGSYGERMYVDLALKRSQTEMNIATTKLAQIEGQSKAESIAAQIQKDISSSKYNDQLRALAQKQASLTEAQILGQYETNKSIRAGVGRTEAETRKIDQEIKNLGVTYHKISKEIVEVAARSNNLDAQSRKIATEIANISLDTQIMNYNLMQSDKLGLRTNESIPSSMWSNIAWTGNTVEDILWGRRDSNLKRFERQLLDWNWKWTPLRWILEKDYPFKFWK